MKITGVNFIGHKESKKGTKSFHTFNPILNKSTNTSFYEATEEEVNEAVENADRVFLEFAALTPQKRAPFLKAIAHELEEHNEELVQVYTQESGLPEGRAYGELNRTKGQLLLFAQALETGEWMQASIDPALPDRQPFPRVDLRKWMFPIGPIVVFGSSNFPFAYSTAGGDTASAFAVGCPVIVKSHPMHAGTGELVSRCILKAAIDTHMPQGVFSNLNSTSFNVGTLLVKHPLVKGVGFTGSVQGGTHLYQLAQQRKEPIPVFAEMGSVNPVVVCKSAQEDGAKWGAEIAGSIHLGSGQFCTNPGLIIALESPFLPKFISELSERFSEKSPETMLHPSIHQKYNEGVEKRLATKGIKLLSTTKVSNAPNSGNGTLLSVSASTFIENPHLHQEVFGPFSILVVCKDRSELNDTLQQLEGQLTASFLGDESELKVFQSSLHILQNKVGRIIYNGVPTGVEVCPSMHHGGPFPATTDSRFTAVGPDAMSRWLRPIAFQNWPDSHLPVALQNTNQLGIWRRINGIQTKESIK